MTTWKKIEREFRQLRGLNHNLYIRTHNAVRCLTLTGEEGPELDKFEDLCVLAGHKLQRYPDLVKEFKLNPSDPAMCWLHLLAQVSPQPFTMHAPDKETGIQTSFTSISHLGKRSADLAWWIRGERKPKPIWAKFIESDYALLFWGILYFIGVYIYAVNR